VSKLRDQVRVTYRTRAELADILARAPVAQAWRIGCDYSTVKAGGMTYRRMFEPMAKLHELAEDLSRAERDPLASSWGGVWRKFSTPPPKMPAMARGIVEAEKSATRGDVIRRPHQWIEERAEKGFHEGAWQEWDLVSAYAWASAQGLPDLRTVHRSARRCISDTGIYLCEGAVHSESGEPDQWLLPTWMRRTDTRVCAEGLTDWRKAKRIDANRKLAWIPGEILNKLCLSPTKVRIALEWDRITDLRPLLDTVRADLPRWWKAVYRAHWGDWGATSATMQESWANGRPVKGHALPSGLRAPLWAWQIQSRVTARVAALAEHAARVFIDSATVPAGYTPSNVGTDLGCWKRKVSFPTGMMIHGLPWKPSLPSLAQARYKPARAHYPGPDTEK
jgi:hypothetical protein